MRPTPPHPRHLPVTTLARRLPPRHPSCRSGLAPQPPGHAANAAPRLPPPHPQVKEFLNATHWPKHLLVHYTWRTQLDEDEESGLLVLFSGVWVVVLVCGLEGAQVGCVRHGAAPPPAPRQEAPVVVSAHTTSRFWLPLHAALRSEERAMHAHFFN